MTTGLCPAFELTAFERSMIAQIRAAVLCTPASRLVANHREVRRGDIFFAWPGTRVDARDYVDAAIAAGAMLVLMEGEPDTGHPQAVMRAGVPCYFIPHLKQRAPLIAAEMLEQPSQILDCVAVTGTNGKSSVTRWVAECLDTMGGACGVLGTLGLWLRGQPVDPEAKLTTPQGIDLQQQLHTLREAGASAVALEASSIGLEQNRLLGACLDVVAFTNLSRDHLDYHGTMEAYFEAKACLAAWPTAHTAVVNVKDAFGPRFADRARQAGLQVIAVASQASGDGSDTRPADIYLRACSMSLQGIQGEIVAGPSVFPFHAPVIGEFNLENLAVVVGVLRALHCSFEQIVAAFPRITSPLGRMDVLTCERQPTVVVDYAHTPDALDKVLRALRPLAQQRNGRLVTVFGCGGQRDAGKRPLMGKIAQGLSDEVWVTSDNPRQESPEQIAEDILSGMCRDEKTRKVAVRVELDRAEAIRLAIMHSRPVDVVLVAGKGHEQIQTIGGQQMAFSDHAQVQQAFHQSAAA